MGWVKNRWVPYALAAAAWIVVLVLSWPVDWASLLGVFTGFGIAVVMKRYADKVAVRRAALVAAWGAFGLLVVASVVLVSISN